MDSRTGKQTPDWELLAPGTARNAPARQQLPESRHRKDNRLNWEESALRLTTWSVSLYWFDDLGFSR